MEEQEKINRFDRPEAHLLVGSVFFARCRCGSLALVEADGKLRRFPLRSLALIHSLKTRFSKTPHTLTFVYLHSSGPRDERIDVACSSQPRRVVVPTARLAPEPRRWRSQPTQAGWVKTASRQATCSSVRSRRPARSIVDGQIESVSAATKRLTLSSVLPCRNFSAFGDDSHHPWGGRVGSLPSDSQRGTAVRSRKAGCEESRARESSASLVGTQKRTSVASSDAGSTSAECTCGAYPVRLHHHHRRQEVCVPQQSG